MSKSFMEVSKFPTSPDAEFFEQEGMRFEFFSTADGSPTLRLSSAMQPPEAMHHSGGALTETEYIYGEALRFAVQSFGPHLKVLSMGLGLGYNEWLTLREAPLVERIVSFEKIDLLREVFLKGLAQANQLTTSPLEKKLWLVFEQVRCLISPHDTQSGWQKLADLFKQRRFQLLGTLEDHFQEAVNSHVILFDAFSKKATPLLWDEEFLVNFLTTVAAPNCILATYAATGTLNRALKRSGFELQERRGFQGKRDSTFAYRMAER